MPIPVTITKVILPQRRKDWLSRQRIFDLLYQLLDHKLFLVIAPAGYGKTSALVDFIHQVDIPACWLSLDANDRSPLTFITNFIAALQQRFPTFGVHSLNALQAVNPLKPEINRLVSVIVNDAYETIKEHFLMVLDDYHLVSGQDEIDTFISQFVREVAENCHLVIASRTLLSLRDMALLAARAQVSGLSLEELTFQTEEIQSLILQNSHITLSDAAAGELARETEGWITGLLLTTQTQWRGETYRSGSRRLSGTSLYDYLAQEILDQQPALIRDFLMQSAYLEEIDAGLCRAIWGEEKDWAGLIETVIQQNLLVLPVGNADVLPNGQVVRYHHLFRDFLQNRYETLYPDEKGKLLHRITTVYANQGEYEKAYLTIKRLDDPSSCADLVEQAGPTLIKNVRLDTLARWIDDLPVDVVVSRPLLLSHKGAVLLNQGQVEEGITYLDRAAVGLQDEENASGLARTLARRAIACRFLGKYPEALADGCRALSMSEQCEELKPVQAEALRAIGMSQYHLGNLPQAIEKLLSSLEVYTALKDKPNVAMVRLELGMCFWIEGEFRRALEQYEQALAFWREVQNTTRLSFVLNNLGVLYHLTGDYPHAIRLFEEALSYARANGFTRSEAYLLCGIGDLYTDLDADSSAGDAFRRTQTLAEKIDDRYLMLYVSIAEAAHARRKGRLARARLTLQSAQEMLQSNRSSYDKAIWRLENGKLCLLEGNTQAAIQSLEEAVETLTEGGQKVEATRANMVLAQAYGADALWLKASAALERAFSLAQQLDNQHILVVAGREVKMLLGQISQDPKIGEQTAALLEQVTAFENRIPILRRQTRSLVNTIILTPPKLTIKALGNIQVALDGKAVTASEWVNQKRARELFFYILVDPEGYTKEEIGADLMPDSSETQLKLQFKNAIYRLRIALGQDVIIYDGYHYRFNQDLDYEYDVQTFEDKARLAKSSKIADEQIKSYQEAITLYRGPYYYEGEGTWAAKERQRLWQIYIEAIINLAWLYLEKGEYRAALEHCQRAIDEDRCVEEAHRLAMRAYAALGDRVAVIRQFETCRQALDEELGIKPSPETISLQRLLLNAPY